MHFSDSFFVYGLLLIYEETGRGSSAEMSRMDKIANILEKNQKQVNLESKFVLQRNTLC